MSDTTEPAARPALQIVRGDATPEEIAVVTALFAAAAAAAPAESTSRVRRGGWNDPARMHRAPLLPGPNAWRSYS
jgi:poly(3-hydroxybutyrate) depolymerase